MYNIQDKCLVVGDQTVCSRTAHDGLFLLDTVFQTSFGLSTAAANTNPSSAKSKKTIELNMNDARALYTALKQIESDNVNGLEDLLEQIKQQLNETSSNPLDRWSTVKLTDTYSSLLSTLTQSLDEIKRVNLQSIAIPILSMLLDRLYRLDTFLIDNQLQNTLGASFSNFDKRYMCSEATRRATFSEWPHMDYKWVLPDALALAGFYHQPTHPGDDRTICFACDLCLVAWEPQDQPW